MEEFTKSAISGLETFCQDIRSGLTETEWATFRSQTTDIGRLKLLQRHEKVESHTLNLLKLCRTRKDKTVAMKLKEAGNKAFGEQDYQKAVTLYTQALVWIPHQDEEDDNFRDTSILYANRSAALFHLKELELTQQDAELAFSYDYPVSLQYKLYERVAKCHFLLGDEAKGKTTIQKAIKAMDSSSLHTSKIIKLKQEFEALPANCRNNRGNAQKDDSKYRSTIVKRKFLPNVVGGGGKYLQNASKRLSLQYEPSQGRFIVANEKLVPGDVILVEKAYTSSLLPESYHRQCFQCFEGMKAPIPCEHCIYASFCSKKCRDEAWTRHHKYECKLLGLLKHSKISPSCYMALRMLTQADPNDVIRWYDLALSTEEDPNRLENEKSIVDDTHISSSKSRRRDRKTTKKLKPLVNHPENTNSVYKTDHEAILHLCTHPVMRNPEDFLFQVVASLFLLEALKTTSYFSSLVRNDEVDANWELKFSLILLRCLQSLPYNAHAFDWEPSEMTNSSGDIKRVEYGCGLFPTLSLFNHSCYPSIVRYIVNDTVVVRVIRNILPGEQVTENYGQHFMTSPKETRQTYLWKNYCFQCNCQPCTENWPDFEALSRQSVLNYRCEHCGSFVCKSNEQLLTHCPKCSKAVHILKSLQLTMQRHEETEELIKAGDLEKGLEALLQNMSMLDNYLVSPVNDLHVYQEHARIFLKQFGNTISKLPTWDQIDLNDRIK